MWSECVWQTADPTNSPTKFIISDHPVTVYNRGCFPGSEYAEGLRIPISEWLRAMHTFPLAIDKVLILTNLPWVRNPYQREHTLRPILISFVSRFLTFLTFKFVEALESKKSEK